MTPGLWAALATATVAQAAPQRVPTTPPAAPAAQAATVDPARLDAARALIETMLPPEERQRMFERTINAYMGNMVAGIMKAANLSDELSGEPELQGIFATFIERQRKLALKDLADSTPELMTAYVNAYARRFDVAELASLKSFFQTPLGHKYAQLTPELLGDPDFAAWQRGVAERGQTRLPGELRTLKEQVNAWLADKKKNHGAS